MAMHNPPHPGEFHYRRLPEAQQPQRSRAGFEARCGKLNSESHPHRRRQHQPRNGAAAFQGAWPLSRELACAAV